MPPEPRLRRLRRELRALADLALPIVVAQLAQIAMGFVDTLMAGRVGPEALAAVALGNSFWVPAYLLSTGILLATTPRVAHLRGAGRQPEIGPLVRQALWLALAVGSAAALLLWNVEPALHLMRVEASLIEPAMGYLRAVACGMPAVALYYVLRCFSDGLGHTRPSMLIGIAGLLLNIPANYVFIHGKLGLPAMGGVGCGWATALVMVFMLLAMLFWVKHAPHYRPSRLFERFDRPRWPELRRLLAVGLPIGVAVFAEASIFSVIALLIGSLGAQVVAGHQIALNFSGLVFMVPYSLGMAVTIRVGHALGRGSPHDARFSTGTGIIAALGFATLAAGLMLLLRERIPHIYSSDPAVIAIASGLLLYSALFQFSDAIQVTAAGALRGYQDTRAIMSITLLAYWGVGLPVGYGLGLGGWLGESSGPRGLWQGMVIGLSCAALLLGARLIRSARRHIHGPAAT
ncbi:MATE family efflux transporter [Azorhizophilus paspali]|uniref:Multidrug-efflux transporter n=1 Tax=Azorhizophilus paspali TaxID=69963 RepID=A0ABV6SLT2_AZOPA